MNIKKTVFLVGSVIDVGKGSFHRMEDTRSYQPNNERFAQTVTGLNSIYNKFPNAKVFLIDASTKPSSYLTSPDTLGISKMVNKFGLEIIHLSQLDPIRVSILNTHPNKSYCEALLYDTFLDHYADRLKEYDFIIKLSGRYNLTPNCNITSLQDKSDFYLKEIMDIANPNNEKWAYEHLMVPGQTGEVINWRASFCLGCGIDRLDDFKNLWKYVILMTKTSGVSIEVILNFWSWKHEINHKELDWEILGFTGSEGYMWLL
jgi:hypothetical protein